MWLKFRLFTAYEVSSRGMAAFPLAGMCYAALGDDQLRTVYVIMGAASNWLSWSSAMTGRLAPSAEEIYNLARLPR